MNTIPEQQLADRWDTIPQILREAITSQVNSELVWKTAEAEHLPKEKIALVSRLTGWVLMGFIHPEEIAKEIQDALGINPNIAASIASTLNSRIFNPLKNDLEKIYAPAVEESKIEQPIIVEEIKKPSAVQSKPIEVTPSALKIPPPLAMPKPIGPTPAPPKIISDKTVPTRPWGPMPKPAIPIPSQESSVISQKSAVPAPAVLVPSSIEGSSVEGPFILHQESEFPPVKSVSGFKLEIPENKFRDAKPGAGIPPRPARIEIGSAPPSQGSPLRPDFAKATTDKQDLAGQARVGGQELRIPVPSSVERFSTSRPLIEIKPPMPSKPPGESQKSATLEPRVVHYSEAQTPFDPTPSTSFDFAQDKSLRTSQGKPLAPSDSKRVEILPPKPPSPPKPVGTVMKENYLPGSENAIALSDESRTEKPSKIAFLLPGLPDPLKEPELPASGK